MESTTDIGEFEGFNFRSQSAIMKTLTAEEVLNWDHDADGEAEFWPDGSNIFVSKLLPGTVCGAGDVSEVIRIFEELDGNERDLVKAAYLRDRGSDLEDITRQAIDDSCLYVFGPGYFTDLVKEAAYELLEAYWPDSYRFWEQNTIPGMHFDPEGFLESFPTLELTIPGGGGYLIVDTE